ncbi:MAG: twin-arginine translocase subunit TatC, partial [Planctomycetota bacterium]
ALEGTADVPMRTAHPDPLVAGDIWLLVPELELYVGLPDEGMAVEAFHVPRRPRASVAQEYRLNTYISFVLMLLLGIVIAFQMPLVILLLGWVGIASPTWLRAQRRYALLACGVLGALLTPADVVSMLALMFPLYGLYELGILLLVIAPASRVAGTGGGDDGPDKTQQKSAQSVEPVQSNSAVSRTPERKDAPDETS